MPNERVGASRLGIPGLMWINERLESTESLLEVARVAAYGAREVTACDAASYLASTASGLITIAARSVGTRTKPVPAHQQGIAGWCAQHAVAVAVEDVHRDRRMGHMELRRSFVRALLAAPVLDRTTGDVAGVLIAMWGSRHQASPQEMELLELISDACSDALERIASTDLHNRSLSR